MSVLDIDEDAEGGVGGATGMKNEGIQAMVAIIETYNTMLGTDPRSGLMSWASCLMLDDIERFLQRLAILELRGNIQLLRKD